MTKADSIIEYLTFKDNDCIRIFEKFNSLLTLLLKDESKIHFRYASARQSINAFMRMNEIVSSNDVDQNNILKYHDDIVVGMRLYLYDKGKTSGLLDAFIHAKRAVIRDLGTSLQAALSGINIVAAITLIRPILEHAGAACIANNKICKLFENQTPTVSDKTDILIKVCEVVSKRGKGTRIDWQTYFDKSLREGRKKSYKRDEGSIDLTASDLMKNIDYLDKSVKGARKAYEFASEFAHPNVGTHFIYTNTVSCITTGDGIRVWDRISTKQLPEYGIDIFQDRIVEMLEIVLDAMACTLDYLVELEKKQKTIRRWTKEIIREGIRNHPLIFNLNEPCPCLSGMKFGKCCGKKVKSLHKKLFV